MAMKLSDGTLTMIPLTICGISVGGARIKPNGDIELVMGVPSKLGQEFKKKIESGEALGLSVSLIEK